MLYMIFISEDGENYQFHFSVRASSNKEMFTFVLNRLFPPNIVPQHRLIMELKRLRLFPANDYLETKKCKEAFFCISLIEMYEER